MPTLRLTAQTVENAKPPKSGRLELWDTLTRGLALRVTDKGAKSWVIMYRIDGRLRRHTLGKYPDLKLSDARDIARDGLRKASKGIDPGALKIAARRAPRQTVYTVETAIEDFIEKYAKPRNRSWRETERIFLRYVTPAWGKRALADITKGDVVDLLEPIAKRAPYMANRVLAALRRLFNWCLEREAISYSPVANVKPMGVEVARDRILTDSEIRALWQTWDDMGWPFGLAFKLLLATGQRREEIAAMRWADIDFHKAIWTLPREQTKADRLHEVPLSSLALEILEAVPRTGEYVFTTTGNSPISGFSKAKRRVDELSEVTGWRVHDLRRTVASGMARIGVAPHVVEKVLNHASGEISGVAAIYNRHGYTDEKRGALEAWGNRISQVLAERSLRLKTVASRA